MTIFALAPVSMSQEGIEDPPQTRNGPPFPRLVALMLLCLTNEHEHRALHERLLANG